MSARRKAQSDARKGKYVIIVPMFEGENPLARRRLILIAIVLATIPCYCLGGIALLFAPQPGSKTATPTPSDPPTVTETSIFTSTPSLTPTTTETPTETPTITSTPTETLTPFVPPTNTPTATATF